VFTWYFWCSYPTHVFYSMNLWKTSASFTKPTTGFRMQWITMSLVETESYYWLWFRLRAYNWSPHWGTTALRQILFSSPMNFRDMVWKIECLSCRGGSSRPSAVVPEKWKANDSAEFALSLNSVTKFHNIFIFSFSDNILFQPFLEILCFFPTTPLMQSPIQRTLWWKLPVSELSSMQP